MSFGVPPQFSSLYRKQWSRNSFVWMSIDAGVRPAKQPPCLAPPSVNSLNFGVRKEEEERGESWEEEGVFGLHATNIRHILIQRVAFLLVSGEDAVAALVCDVAFFVFVEGDYGASLPIPYPLDHSTNALQGVSTEGARV
jgi:hypothetical protein